MRLLVAFGLIVLGACSSSDDAGEEPGGKNPAKPGKDGGANSSKDGGVEVPQATCTMNASPTLSVEERRLVNRLPGRDVPFAKELLEGTGFDRFEREFSAELCTDGKAGASTFDDAKTLVTAAGTRLWRAAVDRVQGKTTSGTLPAGDDRMLYWARLTMTKTLRGWQPSFSLSDAQRGDLEWELERASRGQYDLKLPAAGGVRIVLSGFDPFTLGNPGETDNVNIRIGNPSGASALAYDGLEFQLPSGKTAHIETFVLPVNYGPFERGMQEDTLAPVLREIEISITMSQGSGYRFKLEEYNGRYHGEFPGNDQVALCPTNDAPLPSTPGCNIQIPERWSGYPSMPWQRIQPPQFVESTLPIAPMINANTGANVPRPPGSQASDGNAFDVVWGYDYEAFPDCTKPSTDPFYIPVSTTYPPPGNPQRPPADACARAGSGGDYLSNESAYRATLLRDVFGLRIPVGHIHTPVMTRFQAGNDSALTDATFEAYRSAIVQQGRLLIEAVAKTL